MGYEVKPDGTIVTSTLDEAIALSRRLSGGAQASNAAGRTPTMPEVDPRATKMLEVVADYGDDGVPGGELASKIGLPDAKGLSAYAKAARRQIEELGGGDRLLRKHRTQDGTRWYADIEGLRRIGLLKME